MKQKLLLSAILFLAVFFIFYSCNKKDLTREKKESSSLSSFENPQYPMNLRLAQRYYNKLVREKSEADSSNTQNGKEEEIKMKPIWNKAYVGSTDSTTFVEVPLFYNKRSSSVIRNKDQTISEEDEKKVLNSSFDRLLISKNKKTGKVTQFIINYIPSLNYLNKHKGDASNNQFYKLEKDFSGFLQLKNWSGKPFELYRAEQGKVARKFKNFNASQGGRTARLVCVRTEEWCDVTWTRTCTSGEGEGHTSYCTEWEQTINYCWDECVEWQDDGTTDPNDPGDVDPDNPAELDAKRLYLIPKLNAILRPGDWYVFDQTIDPNNAQTYSSVENLASSLNSPLTFTFDDNSSISAPEDTVLRLHVNKTLLGGYNIFIKMVKDYWSIYNVTEITSSMWGMTIGYDFSVNAFSSSLAGAGPREVIVTIEGSLKWYIFLEGVGTVYTQRKVYKVKLDRESPRFVSASEIQ